MYRRYSFKKIQKKYLTLDLGLYPSMFDMEAGAMSQGLYIGKVAKETGLSIHGIRFYERERLLREPIRSEGGYRIFDQSSVSELKFMQKVQALGFSLQEIRELLVLRRSSSPGCSHMRELIRQKLALVEGKIQELTRLRDELRVDVRKCNRAVRLLRGQQEKRCPVLEELGRSSGNGEVFKHED